MEPIQVLALNSEWSSRKGGLSTLNRELCIGLAVAGHKVVCYVPYATQTEIDNARNRKVDLIVAPDIPGLPLCCRLCLKPPGEFDPDVIIGHEHITGSAAHALAEIYYPRAKRVFVIHTAPEEIEWPKNSEGSSARAHEKVKAQLERARKADLTVTIGPRLHRKFEAPAYGAELRSPMHILNPGCGDASQEKRKVIAEIQILILGRAEDFELKGLDLAIKAFAELKVSLEPKTSDCCVLIVRGAEAGKGDALKQKLLAMQTGLPEHSVQVYEYSSDEGDMRSHLRQATMLLMPSKVEGFGLVGLEALSAGVPVLISASSGLAEVIRERLSSHADPMILTSSADDDTCTKWASRMKQIISDREAANEHARFIRDKLSSCLRWEDSVSEFEKILDAILHSEKAAGDPPGAPQVATQA
ncbi:MAG: glycosyltransferase family 4 protein [Cyanobacteria bacterium SZAS-4]|nr:glycosyltransferase family 4 protein [Cyanobacteria bacterium SZAS-4]